jgi:hypothetical protein
MKKITFFFLIILCPISWAELYKPFFHKDKNKIELFTGYCKNSKDEYKLWSSINKFSESILFTLPAVPPEQVQYIESEMSSGNDERSIRAAKNPYWLIMNILESAKNLRELSTQYLNYKDAITDKKRMEYFGRTLLNLKREIEYSQTDYFAKELNKKDYPVTSEDLESIIFSFGQYERNLKMTLICFGENENRKQK